MIYIIIRIAYILGLITIGLFLYYWSAISKTLSELSIEELNEDEDSKEDLINESETKLINYVGSIIFILIGFVIWAYLGTTIGRIASEITDHKILKWFCYILMYFIFLRFPFGVSNRMVKSRYDFNQFSEKVIFSITMISFYILAICCFDIIPNFFKWHLIYLN